MSQKNEILKDLLDGKKITAIDALRDHGCFRAAARIKDIRKMGYKVDTELVSLENGKFVAQYSITKKERLTRV